ncbi:MAG: OsmC family protein [Sporolactobacillus sp.]
MELIQQSETLELVHENGNWLLSRTAGFSPVQMVAAAAAACSTYVLEELIGRDQIPCRLVRVLFDYLEDPAYPHPVSQINVLFYLQTDEKLHGEIRKAFLEIPQNCPVIQSLHPRIQVNESIIFVAA